MSTVTQFICENGIGINSSFGDSCETQEWRDVTNIYYTFHELVDNEGKKQQRMVILVNNTNQNQATYPQTNNNNRSYKKTESGGNKLINGFKGNSHNKKTNKRRWR